MTSTRSTRIAAALAFALTARGQTPFDTYRFLQYDLTANTNIKAVATDIQGNVYVAGTTTSLGFPVKNAWQPEPAGHQILRSLDRGASWVPVANSPTLRPAAVAAHPAIADFLLVSSGDGIFKSVDGGATWRLVSQIGPQSGGHFVFDPANPDRIFLSGGLRSADGGETWAETPAHVPYPPQYVRDLEVDPNGSGTLVGTLVIDEILQLPAISRDGGITWSKLTPIPGLIYYNNYSFVPGHPGWIYQAPRIGDSSQLFLSTDWGTTWTAQSQLLDQPYDWLAVDQGKPTTLYLSTRRTLRRSVDGGVTFGPNLDYLSNSNPTVLGSNCSGGAILAISTFNSVSLPSNLATVSWDGGATWTTKRLPDQFVSFQAGPGCEVYAIRQVGSEAFLSKIAPDGVVQWATYFGGTGDETVSGLQVDPGGNLILSGTTTSADFPGSYYDPLGNAFIAKFDNVGQLQFASVLDGATAAVARPGPDGTTTRIGSLWDANYQQHSFVERFNSTGSLLFRTEVPAPVIEFAVDPSGWTSIASDHGISNVTPAGEIATTFNWTLPFNPLQAAASDAAGNFYFAGWIYPPPLIGGYDSGRHGAIWVAKWLSAEARLEYLARIGDILSFPKAIAVGPDQSVAVGMWTTNVDLPLLHPMAQGSNCIGKTDNGYVGFYGIAVSVLDPSGTRLVNSTYFNECQIGMPLAFGADNRVLTALNGTTSSTPVPGSIQFGHSISNVYQWPLQPTTAIQLEGVGNVFSGTREGISQDMIVEVVGTNLGPAEAMDLGLAGGAELPVELGGSRVWVNGIAASMISVSSERLVCVPPKAPMKDLWDIVTVVVERDGMRSNTLMSLRIFASPQVWRGTLKNQDGTPNDQDHPAAAGSPVSMLLTGAPVGYDLFPYWNGVGTTTTVPVTAATGYIGAVQRVDVKAPATTGQLRFASRRAPNPRNPDNLFIEDWEMSVPVTVYVK